MQVKNYKYLSFGAIVAISDEGRIDRSSHDESELVFKADQIADEIRNIYKAQLKLDNPLTLSLKIPDWTFKRKTISKVAEFLVASHCPVVPVAQEPPSVPKKQEQVKATPKAQEEEKIKPIGCCPKCHGNVSILWGNKFKNYYWHCNECGKNISIKFKCPQCSEKLRIRKQKKEYHIYCEPCSLSALFYTSEE